MTNSWTDIRNADVILILGSNAAENHPMAMQHVQKALDNGGILINVDPRFNRSSARANIHAFMRSGTDIAFIGGMIKYAIDNGLYNEKYVRECTNALLKVNSDFKTSAENGGVFSGFNVGPYNATLDANLGSSYTKTTWNYSDTSIPVLAADLDDPDCVFQKLKTQFDEYTKANVCSITGTDPDVYEQICQTFCGSYPDTKSATIMYAMGTTQHTVGTQNIRAYAILQLLLGNMGVAGGGINALRGQDNVQGATDHAVLHHILPGYLKVPAPGQDLAAYNAANYNATQAVNPVHDYTVRGAYPVDPGSAHWWQNGTKYIASLVKAWWPTVDHNVSFDYLSKKTGDHSILSMFHAMGEGDIEGFICCGENPAVSDPDAGHVRHALENLEWMVCIDPFESETAAFWKRPGAVSADINTTVYLLPCAVGIEKFGSRSNSSRWAQWHWADNVSLPGEAKTDLEIITLLGQALKGVISDAPVANLSWPCLNYAGQTEDALAELVAKEMHGYTLDSAGNTTGLVSNFVALSATGGTACGNWLCSGSFGTDGFDSANQAVVWPFGGVGNRMKRRYAPDVPNGGPAGDPQYPGIGLYSYWSWCWPINRRVVYNRAATYQNDGDAGLAGDPLAPSKYVIRWDGGWKGDVPDHGGNPGAVYPFIMTKEGHGHLFGGWTVAEGPFPWHYEPAESPIPYPSWLGTYRMNPTVHFYPGSLFAQHGDSEFDVFATTYRLTEHYHTGTMTRNTPRLNELQPEPFVEMSEEFAGERGIANGELVTVSSARGSIQVKACVTKRFKPFTIEGQTVHQVGIIWHWGYQGLSKGDSGNILTPYIGDANTRIPESKAFRVKIEKV